MGLSKKAIKARREYKRGWYEENKEHVRAYNRQYRKDNPEKIAKAQNRYWERMAKEEA